MQTDREAKGVSSGLLRLVCSIRSKGLCTAACLSIQACNILGKQCIKQPDLGGWPENKNKVEEEGACKPGTRNVLEAKGEKGMMVSTEDALFMAVTASERQQCFV